MLLREGWAAPQAACTLPGLAESRVSRRDREVWPTNWDRRGLYRNKTTGRGGKRGEEKGRGGREVKMQQGVGSEGKGRSGVEMQGCQRKGWPEPAGLGRFCRATRQRSWEGKS